MNMRTFTDFLKKVDKFIINMETILSAGGILFITLMVAIGVFSRTFAGYTFSFIEELAQYLMVWVAIFGAVLCVSSNGHVGVDVIFAILPKRFHNFFNAILALISSGFLLWLTDVSYKYVLTVKQSNQMSVSMTWLPMYVLYLSVVIGGILMAFEYIKICVSLVRKGFKGQLVEDEVSVEDMEKI